VSGNGVGVRHLLFMYVVYVVLSGKAFFWLYHFVGSYGWIDSEGGCGLRLCFFLGVGIGVGIGFVVALNGLLCEAKHNIWWSASRVAVD